MNGSISNTLFFASSVQPLYALQPMSTPVNAPLAFACSSIMRFASNRHSVFQCPARITNLARSTSDRSMSSLQSSMLAPLSESIDLLPSSNTMLTVIPGFPPIFTEEKHSTPLFRRKARSQCDMGSSPHLHMKAVLRPSAPHAAAQFPA